MSAARRVEDTTPFRFSEKAGPHSVGLQVIEQYDHSRVFRHLTDELGHPFTGERARPLQTLIWYPAKADPGKPMTVRDYTELWAIETSFGRPKLPARAREWISAMAPTLEMPLWAVRDAAEAGGRFPLVVYAPSFSSVSWENADLCEYLASHGFVVLAAPSLGATTRHMTADVAGIRTQAADISFLIGYACTLANTDLSEVAVAGFSWGGISNVFAAMRDNRIKALVALDGSLRYWPGMLRQAGDVRPEAMTIPLMAFAKTEWTLEEQARYLTPAQIDGPNVLNAWVHGDLYAVHMLGMTHRQYGSMFQRNEDVWKDFHDPEFPDRRKADYGREDGMTAYGCVARYTLQFLNAYLKQDAAAAAYLSRSPASNGVPRHFMEVNYRPAKGIPTSCDALRAEIGRRGFDRAEEIFADMQEDNPDAKLDEGSVNSWADELIDAGRLSEAIVLLSLNVRTYPDSSNAESSLARARLLSGERQAAIEGYRRALEKNRVNAEARRQLRELDSETER
jgi:hypothetical protein